MYGTALISRELNGQKSYYFYNGHGDVTMLFSAPGFIAASYDYDAFGAEADVLLGDVNGDGLVDFFDFI